VEEVSNGNLDDRNLLDMIAQIDGVFGSASMDLLGRMGRTRLYSSFKSGYAVSMTHKALGFHCCICSGEICGV